MVKEIKVKEFNFNEVEGITKNQLIQHYKLYEGYVKSINKIWNILRYKEKYDKPNTTYSEMRSLKLGESYALNGVKLHEMYFENLGGKNNKIYGDINKLIIRDYGSYEKWEKRFIDTALSMRGWVVLAYDEIDNCLHTIGQDGHDMGSIWKSHPLLVLDVYEHAYMIDFGINRREYIDIFINNIDWDVVNTRLHKLFFKQNL